MRRMRMWKCNVLAETPLTLWLLFGMDEFSSLECDSRGGRGSSWYSTRLWVYQRDYCLKMFLLSECNRFLYAKPQGYLQRCIEVNMIHAKISI